MCGLLPAYLDAVTARVHAQIVVPLWKKSSQSHSIDTNSLVSSLAAAAAAAAAPMSGGFLRKAHWVSSVARYTTTFCSPVPRLLARSSFARVGPPANGLMPLSSFSYAPTRSAVTSSSLQPYAFT